MTGGADRQHEPAQPRQPSHSGTGRQERLWLFSLAGSLRSGQFGRDLQAIDRAEMQCPAMQPSVADHLRDNARTDWANKKRYFGQFDAALDVQPKVLSPWAQPSSHCVQSSRRARHVCHAVVDTAPVILVRSNTLPCWIAQLPT
jgi:hypothetical protein